MKITRFNHAAVNIHGNVEQAREFYLDLLGLPEVPIQLPGRPPVPKGAVQAFWLELGGCQVHAIGVTTRQPVPALANVPTIEQACGLPGFESSTWYGIFAPAGLPEPILRRMNTEINRIVAEPEFRRWLTDSQGITPPQPLTSEQFREVQQRDIARWAEVVRKSGATVD